MTLEEIVIRDISKNNIGTTLEQAKQLLGKFSKAGAKFLRYGNTVFIVYKITETAVFFHTINADKLKQFIRNIKKFYKDMFSINKTFAITYFNNDKIIAIYKRYGDEVVCSDNPRQFKYKGISNLRRWQNGLG